MSAKSTTGAPCLGLKETKARQTAQLWMIGTFTLIILPDIPQVLGLKVTLDDAASGQLGRAEKLSN